MRPRTDSEVDSTQVTRRLQSSNFAVSYTISYDPAVVTVDIATVAATVDAAAAAAVANGDFATSIASNMPAEYRTAC